MHLAANSGKCTAIVGRLACCCAVRHCSRSECAANDGACRCLRPAAAVVGNVHTSLGLAHLTNRWHLTSPCTAQQTAQHTRQDCQAVSLCSVDSSASSCMTAQHSRVLVGTAACASRHPLFASEPPLQTLCATAESDQCYGARKTVSASCCLRACCNAVLSPSVLLLLLVASLLAFNLLCCRSVEQQQRPPRPSTTDSMRCKHTCVVHPAL